jgi:hypothetical protein
MTVYAGRTFQTSALRVWGVWVSMRDFRAAMKYQPTLLKVFINGVSIFGAVRAAPIVTSLNENLMCARAGGGSE